MTTLERIAFAVLVVGSSCYAAAQRPHLAAVPTFVDVIRPQGILELGPGAVEALVLPGSNTVFIQADTNELAVWDGRDKIAGVVGVTLKPGDSLPDPDDKPALTAHGGEVGVVFVARDGQVLAAGIVYRPQSRT
jgi:hypothetical protein